MFSLLKAEGHHPLVRNSSFLGFPCVFIVVPGFSEIYIQWQMKYKTIVTTRKTRRSFDHFPDLNTEEELRLLKLIEFNEYSVRDNQVKYFTARQLSDKYDLRKIGAYLSLKHGKYEKALHFFSSLATHEEEPDEKLYYKAMVIFSECRKNGSEAEKSMALVRAVCRNDIAERVNRVVSDIDNVIKRQFEKVNCFDCANCKIAGRECTYPVTREIVRKVMSAMKKENASQEEMLELLKEVY